MTWSTICGSFEYLSPEILQHVKIFDNADKIEQSFSFTTQSEVWSLGVILYGMIYCRLPFVHNNKLELIHLVLNSDISYEPLNIIYNQNLKNLLKSMLEKDPNSRINFLQVCNHPFFVCKAKKGNCRISNSYRTDIHKLAQEFTYISDINANSQTDLDNTNFQSNCNDDQLNLVNVNCSKKRVNVRNSSSLNIFLNSLSISCKMNEAQRKNKFWKFHNANPIIVTPKLIKNI